MTRWNRIQASVFPALVGVAAGLFTTWWASPDAPSSSVDARDARTVVTANDPRWAGHEARLRALERAGTTPPPHFAQPFSASPDTDRASDEPVVSERAPVAPTTTGYRTPDEERATVSAILEEAMSRFDEEPIDPAWADAARASIESEAADVLEAYEVELGSVECRSETCIFDASAEHAGQLSLASGRLLTTDFGLGCARTSTVLESERPAVRIVLDCGRDS